MSEQEWENMEFNCLVNILGRVGMESLFLHVPFVCKSWYKASLDPSCWLHIDLENLFENPFKKIDRFEDIYRVKNFSYGGLMRLIIARGHGKATSLVLPRRSSDEFLELAAKKCSQLKLLSSNKYANCLCAFPKLLGKWNLFEELRFDGIFGTTFLEIAAEIEQKCKNFHSLTLYDGVITDGVDLVIAVHLRKLKKLSLLHCDIEQENLAFIVSSCRDLELLDVNNCKFSGTWDEEKLRVLTSHIKTLNLDASLSSLEAYYDEYPEYVDIGIGDFWYSDSDSDS